MGQTEFPRDSLPAARKGLSVEKPEQEDDDSDEDFELDDIQAVTTHGIKLSDLSLQNPNNLD